MVVNSRKNNNSQGYQQPHPDHTYNSTDPKSYGYAMYPRIDKIRSQQGMISNSPVPNAPPTPFDSNYGATLLPSHLLMGSPYVSSPDLQQPYYYYQQPQQFGPRKSGYSLHTNPHGRATNGNDTRTGKQLTKDSVDDILIQEKSMLRLFDKPFNISYTLLPKGDDAYRTRSLLFENIDTTISLHSFISEYVKSNSIESIYIVESENKDKHSFLLSFISAQICLNFYNNVLQRLKEFKINLKSESLNLSFVSLQYKNSLDENVNTGEENKNKDDKISSYELPHYPLEIKTNDATRSITIELSKECSKEQLMNEQLPLLKKENGNNRYILESIYLINAESKYKGFPKHYAIITFLNISMATEFMDLIRLDLKKYNIKKTSFVNMYPLLPKQAGNLYPMSATEQEFGRNTSVNSLISSKSSISVVDEANLISDRLESIDLSETIFSINPNKYPQPFYSEESAHLPDTSISRPTYVGPIMATPRAQEMYVNDISPLREDSSLFEAGEVVKQDDINGFPIGNLSRTHLAMSSSFYMDAPPFKMMDHTITDSLEHQLNTSAKVASAMGSDAGNRTIYIGNISPRSKVEDICNVVRGGILQNVKFIESKHICFVTFIEASAAVQFYANAFIDPIILHGNTLKLGWGNYSGPLPKSVALAVTVGGSRNVYVSLPEFAFKDKFINDPDYKEYHEKYSLPSAEQLRQDFSSYGMIEQINYLNDSHCCWVNFMNINSAIKLVEEANNEPDKFSEKFSNRYNGLIISYGKDRCGNINRNLIAGKNSRFNKRVRRPNNNVRLTKLEEKRNNEENIRRGVTTFSEHSSDQRKSSNCEIKQFQLDSLGISLADTNVGPSFEHRTVETSPEEGKNDSNVELDQAGTTEEDKDNDSDVYSDVEFIINGPIQSNYSDGSILGRTDNSETDKERKIINRYNQTSGKQSNGKRYNKTNIHEVNGNGRRNQRRTNIDRQGRSDKHFVPPYKNGSNQRNSRTNKNNRGARTIPGSDVMAQYLAQLQHSTFMYAANILGVSNEETEYYDPSELQNISDKTSE